MAENPIQTVAMVRQIARSTRSQDLLLSKALYLTYGNGCFRLRSGALAIKYIPRKINCFIRVI